MESCARQYPAGCGAASRRTGSPVATPAPISPRQAGLLPPQSGRGSQGCVRSSPGPPPARAVRAFPLSSSTGKSQFTRNRPHDIRSFTSKSRSCNLSNSEQETGRTSKSGAQGIKIEGRLDGRDFPVCVLRTSGAQKRDIGTPRATIQFLKLKRNKLIVTITNVVLLYFRFGSPVVLWNFKGRQHGQHSTESSREFPGLPGVDCFRGRGPSLGFHR